VSFTEKINVIIDVTMDKANAGIQGFKKSVAEAEGASGKFKAGASSLGQTLQGVAGPAALAAGAALVTFGIKAVAAFEDTAKAAIDLGAATGLATEDASRWIAVGDDMGVGADSLTSGIGKIAKSLDDTKWGDYGIATRDAAGNARDANDILLDTFDMLGKVGNETERARIGNELFGKGYANLAPMIGKSRAEYDKMLDSVESGQVITNEEAAKAERMRLAQDALSDALNEVTMAVGGLVADMAPMIQTTADAILKVTELESRFGILDKTMTVMQGPVGLVTKALDLSSEAIDTSKMSLEELTKMMDDNGISAEDQSKVITQWKKDQAALNSTLEGASPIVQGLSKDVRDDKAAMDEAKQATANLNEQMAILNGTISQKKLWDDYATALWNYNDGAGDTAAELDTLRLAAANVVLALKDMPEEQKTNIIAQINQGDIDTVNAILANYAKGINVPLRFQGQGGVGFMKNATGTSSSPGGLTLVGEQGPELVNMPRGAQVIPAGQTARILGGGGGGTTVVNQVNNIRTNADYRQITRALNRAARRGTTPT
jgi:hypothetical protein